MVWVFFYLTDELGMCYEWIRMNYYVSNRYRCMLPANRHPKCEYISPTPRFFVWYYQIR